VVKENNSSLSSGSFSKGMNGMTTSRDISYIPNTIGLNWARDFRGIYLILSSLRHFNFYQQSSLIMLRNTAFPLP
jgi:hypothetical protein